MDSRKTVTIKLWNKLMANVRKRQLFPDGASVLLAVSGGPDSVVMLDFFAGQERAHRLRLCVCHINHKLRGAAAGADASFVKELGAHYGIETVILSADVKKLAARAGTGIEQAARTARYRLLSATALKKKYAFVATAHHSDDHVETILLNLLRGTEPKGLLGIPARRELCRKGKFRVELIRPMLAVARRDIEVYLKANGLPSRKDHTNDDEHYRRNWIRKTLLPLLEKKQPRLREHLAELSAKLAKTL
ncbi:MAG: tRNA lysidine(34) synthetase TilS [Elusimicrobia bacterium RIFOXYA2_FULL_58_8]|nr:MAG: tRNA lysidine(34) synthetase TilS [Elusimicrobia bacterium RIFOXYA12_FULL_57_11]OGS16576.1 MAG: tRNA lysidine(34) synthetase TilS [Elusimicrobia bacterium RIFOXYA2_FULL_58_8]